MLAQIDGAPGLAGADGAALTVATGLASRAMSSTGTSTRSSSRFGTRASTMVTGRQAIDASTPSNSS
jgi:hypothetical protein